MKFQWAKPIFFIRAPWGTHLRQRHFTPTYGGYFTRTALHAKGTSLALTER